MIDRIAFHPIWMHIIRRKFLLYDFFCSWMLVIDHKFLEFCLEGIYIIILILSLSLSFTVLHLLFISEALFLNSMILLL